MEKLIRTFNIWFSTIAIAQTQERLPYVGGICNADADEVIYNFAGVWEKNQDGTFFCNYEKFLSSEEIKAAQYKNEIQDEDEEYDEELEEEWEDDDKNDGY